MCETLAFLQTGFSILSVAYYERFWRFCGYRCVSKDKLTGWRSGHTVTRTQFYFFPGEKTFIPQQKCAITIWIQLFLPYYSWIAADVIFAIHSRHPL